MTQEQREALIRMLRQNPHALSSDLKPRQPGYQGNHSSGGDCINHLHTGPGFLGERLGSGDGEGWTLLTRQIAFEPLPASVLLGLGSICGSQLIGKILKVWKHVTASKATNVESEAHVTHGTRWNVDGGQYLSD